MIFGINCGRFSFTLEFGAGMSDGAIANVFPSSKRREIRVLHSLVRYPITTRIETKKIMVPRRILRRIRRNWSGCGIDYARWGGHEDRGGRSRSRVGRFWLHGTAAAFTIWREEE